MTTNPRAIGRSLPDGAAMFQPRSNIFGMNDLRVSHTRFPDDITGDAEAAGIIQDMRDELARKLDDVYQWLHRMGAGFISAADCEIDPREVVEIVKQDIEESLLAPIDRQIQALSDAAPPTMASRPGLHGLAP